MRDTPRALRAIVLATALAALLALAAPVTSGLAAAVPTRDDPGATPTWRPVRERTPSIVAPAAATTERRRDAEGADGPARVEPATLVRIPSRGLAARRNPWSSSPTIGRVVGHSRYYGVPTMAWVEQVSRNGRFGRVELPYVWPRRDGWIRLEGLATETTGVAVLVDISAHRLTVRKRGEVQFRAPVATGRSSSPTPPGEYFVTDRVPFAAGSAYGSFAFGISGIQPRLPIGWTGGDQLAIHGTNAPWTIGTNASAGCVRAGEATLDRLKPMLRLGTPVVIVP